MNVRAAIEIMLVYPRVPAASHALEQLIGQWPLLSGQAATGSTEELLFMGALLASAFARYGNFHAAPQNLRSAYQLILAQVGPPAPGPAPPIT